MAVDKIEALRARVAKLDPEQREKMRAQVEAAGIPWERVAPKNAIKPARPDHMPLSPAQMQFWLMHQVNPDSTASAIAFSWALTGPLNRDALARAFRYLVDRHAPLRTCFPSQDGAPWQELRDVPFDLEVSSLDPSDYGAAERAFVGQPFDMEQGPLFRAHLVQLGPEEHRLMMSLHHIIADGWSRGVFVRELAAAYRAYGTGQQPALPDLTHDFADMLLVQQDWLQGNDAAQQSLFWQEKLAGFEHQPLPTKADARPLDQQSETLLLDLDPALSRRMREGAAHLGATLFMLLLAVFKLLLHRYTGQTDLAVGTPTAGRQDPDAAGLIGLFVNTLVLRTQLNPNASFAEWLTEVRYGFAQSFDNQELPFATVVDAVGAERRAGQTPLFQTLFQVQTDGYRHQNAARLDLGDPTLHVTQDMIPLPETKFDLSWHMMERETGLSLIVEYRTGLFENEFIRRMASHFQTLLASVLENPSKPVAQLDFLSKQERQSLVIDGPRTTTGPNIADRVATVAASAPDTEALIFGDITLSYAELDHRISDLAQKLRGHPEVSDGSRVVVALERGPDLVIALLAALRAGMTYVPLDPTQPKTRKAHILQDAQADLVITDAWITNEDCPQVSIADLDMGPMADLVPVSPDALAYIIYTSGSTGHPKGVPITHRSLSNLIDAMIQEPGISSTDRFLAITTVGFDIAGLELFGPLCAGGTLVLADRETILSPPALIDIMQRRSITQMQATPALWRALVDSGWQGKSDLTLLCGGEALDTGLARALLERGKALWNMYGPTETTIWSATLQVNTAHLSGAVVPVGGPIANTGLQVLDRYGQTLPSGIPGELAISGAGLSPGYWNRPELTHKAFTKDLYRTGDLVVLQDDNTLRFLGRTDHQVKLNGFRIEPGEIETALVETGLTEALVVLDAKLTRLIAYCRPDGAAPETADLKQALLAKLPTYMVPSAFVFLERFELNANGKIDRSKLPAPDIAMRPASRTPETDAEKTLHAIWCSVLNLEKVGVEDNFFDLGGASVTVMQIVARARDEGLELQPAQLFEHQTIAAQAKTAKLLQQKIWPFSPWQDFIRDKKIEPWLVTLVAPTGAMSHLAQAVERLADDHPVLRFAMDAGWKTGQPVGEISAPQVDLGAWARAQVTELHPWRACITPDNRLAVAAHPMLLDATSVERLARLLRERLDTLIAGQPLVARPGGDFAAWLLGPQSQTASSPSALPGAPAGYEERTTPIQLEVSGSDLMQIRSAAQVMNSDPEVLTLTALAQTLCQWSNLQHIGLDVLTSSHAPVGQFNPLGNFTRLLPLSLAHPKGDPVLRVAQVTQSMATDTTLGIAPRETGGTGTLLSWRSAIAPDIEWLSRPNRPTWSGYAITVEAEMTSDKLSLLWRFDRTHIPRATVENLANRHLSALAALKPSSAQPVQKAGKQAGRKPSGKGNRLDQLKAQIRRPKG